MSLAIGTVIDDTYKIVCVLGEGGLGQVLLAHHLRLDAYFAVKILRPQVARVPEIVARFEQEARACAQIRSDNVVRVVDVGRLPEGEPYLVMEYLEGENLEVRLDSRGRLGARELVDVGVQTLEGLASVHAVGVLHRDVKPANIFLSRTSAGQRSAKLVDFGVAKAIHAHGPDFTSTKPGIAVGTPAYMSPEQVRGGPVDARSDIFSLGIVLYEAATGSLPFRGELATEIMASILRDEPPPLSRHVADFDPLLGTIIRRALARDPRDRYASATEMSQVLCAWRTLAFADDAASESVERLSGDRFVGAQVTIGRTAVGVESDQRAIQALKRSGVRPRTSAFATSWTEPLVRDNTPRR